MLKNESNDESSDVMEGDKGNVTEGDKGDVMEKC